jgi:hypothetical protein
MFCQFIAQLTSIGKGRARHSTIKKVLQNAIGLTPVLLHVGLVNELIC